MSGTGLQGQTIEEALMGSQVGGSPLAVQTQTPRRGGMMNALNGLMSNPAAMMGMGLLSAGYDSRVNPYQAGMAGLMGASQFKSEQGKQKLASDQRDHQNHR